MVAANQMISRRIPPPAYSFAVSRCVEATDRRQLERDLRAAIASGILVLHYQPRLCLVMGKIVANEALVRWPHRKQGLLPGILIPAAQRSNLIDLVGAWVLAEACEEAVCWNAARVSVNVSARQLQSGVLPRQLATALEQSGLPPGRLELELTASLLVDSSTDALLALSSIRDLGIGLTLNGLGTGFANSSTLKRLPLTAVRLDRSLVRELPTSREGAAIVRAVVETSRAMRLTTVAEGIETEAQRAFLSGVGCDEGQGDLFSHPLPSEQLRPMLGAARF